MTITPSVQPAASGPPASTLRPRFYFVDEAAAELRRSSASVRWMIHNGTIKTGKIAGRIVIAATEVDRIINEALGGGDAA